MPGCWTRPTAGSMAAWLGPACSMLAFPYSRSQPGWRPGLRQNWKECLLLLLLCSSPCCSLSHSPVADKRGWELTSTLTTPLMGQLTDSRIYFGDLLGAGSYGRVYKYVPGRDRRGRGAAYAKQRVERTVRKGIVHFPSSISCSVLVAFSSEVPRS